jgi:hypothetical protein
MTESRDGGRSAVLTEEMEAVAQHTGDGGKWNSGRLERGHGRRSSWGVRGDPCTTF